jgi:hypothetical protein
MSRLDQLKGKKVTLRLTHLLIEQSHPILITTLVDVDSAGIWIESPEMNKTVHAMTKNAMLPDTGIFFVPFAQVAWILSSAGYPSLSEEGLGV